MIVSTYAPDDTAALERAWLADGDLVEFVRISQPGQGTLWQRVAEADLERTASEISSDEINAFTHRDYSGVLRADLWLYNFHEYLVYATDDSAELKERFDEYLSSIQSAEFDY